MRDIWVSNNIFLERIVGSKKQVSVLFQLLKQREHNISNTSIPSFADHSEFVKGHPYRAWYLIKLNELYVGSVYVMKNNCIGISMTDSTSFFPQIINAISKKYRPLKEIKSVRPPFFYINIAPNNTQIESQLLQIGATKIQSTYTLESIKINF